MLSSIAKILVKSQITRENTTRKKKFLPWDNIEKIALIINKDDSVNKSAIDKFVEGTRKYVEVFYIEIKSKDSSYNDWHCFSKKDRSLFNLPKKNIESGLRHKKFDVVINTCEGDNLFSTAICSSLSAPLKCTTSSKFNDGDMIIKKTEPFHLLNYLADTIKYLKMIRV
jgi:hypothetical protein